MQRMQKKKKNVQRKSSIIGVNQSPSPKLKHLDLINEISIRFLPTPKEKLRENEGNLYWIDITLRN